MRSVYEAWVRGLGMKSLGMHEATILSLSPLPTSSLYPLHTHTHAHAHTHARTHTHTRMHTHACTHTHTHAHTRTHTEICLLLGLQLREALHSSVQGKHYKMT